MKHQHVGQKKKSEYQSMGWLLTLTALVFGLFFIGPVVVKFFHPIPIVTLISSQNAAIVRGKTYIGTAKLEEIDANNHVFTANLPAEVGMYFQIHVKGNLPPNGDTIFYDMGEKTYVQELSSANGKISLTYSFGTLKISRLKDCFMFIVPSIDDMNDLTNDDIVYQICF